MHCIFITVQNLARTTINERYLVSQRYTTGEFVPIQWYVLFYQLIGSTRRFLIGTSLGCA